MRNNSDYYDYEESIRESSGLKRFCDRTGISAFFEKYWKVLASVMVVLVLIGYIPLYMQKGIVFEGEFYIPEKLENGMHFGDSGYYDRFNILVERPNTETCNVTYTTNDTTKDYRLSFSNQKDLLIYENDELYFEGTVEFGRSNNDSYILISKEDEMPDVWDVSVYYGRMPKSLSVRQIFDFYLGVEDRRGNAGSPESIFLALIIFGMWLIDIWFPRFFFLLRYSMSVDNPEPSDWYVIIQKVGWVLWPILAVGLLVFSLV